MLKDIDIFITAFKPFKEYVTDERYKIVTVKDFNYEGKLEWYKDNVGDNISDMNDFFNELTVFYWVWKNYPMKEYVGMCSYRRYFNFLDDIDNIEEDIKKYDIIVPQITNLNGLTNKKQYENCHNLDDLELINKIIKMLHPDYIDDVNIFMDETYLYANNMFIMKRDEYIKYCIFLFEILNEYLKIMNFETIEDIQKYVHSNKELFENKKNNITKKLDYQVRIGGFLTERIFSIYVKHNFKNLLKIPINFTERKYIKKNKK